MARDLWVISDTHFSHHNILKFTKPDGTLVRPDLKDVDEMNEMMIERWNSVVKPQDKIYHLGDVYFGGGFGRDHHEKILSRLNGHKRLILGNHDNGKDQILHKYFEKIDVWRKMPEFGLLLTHIPVHQNTLAEPRFGGGDILNVHGHIHHNASPDGPYQCVCVEQVNYTPVNLEDLRIR